MERQLRTQERWLATILQSMSDGVIATDTHGYVTLMNPQSEVLTGWRQHQAAGKPFAEIFQTVPQHTPNQMRTLTERVLEQKRQVALSPDSVLITRDGREVPIEGQVSPMQDEQNEQNVCLGMVCVFRDISERKQAEETLQRRAVALAQTNEDLRIGMTERKRAEEALHALSHQLLQAQEKERREIARELHDEIGQALTALKINLDSVHTNAVVSDSTARLTDSLSIVSRLLQQVRDLSLDLRPSMLDDLGLVAALRWYVDRQAQRMGFTAEFVAGPLEPRPSPAIETVCFRIAQEAVTNMARHAQAQRVRIELRHESHTLLLRIRDDGVGFDVQAAQERALSMGSMGLRGMHERVQLVGGRIETISAPGSGTEIRATFPLSTENEDAYSEELV
jgi:two-component system sensor histidine kinase UhpB